MSMFEEEKVTAEPKEEVIGNLHLMPKNTHTMIATIDADTLVYAVCSVCEAGDDETGYTIDLDYAVKEAIERVDNILAHTGCMSVELHFTSGKNFRFTLTDTYKSNRKDRTPEGLYDLKLRLLSAYQGKMHTDIEADDYVSWQKKYHPNDYIVCSPDKDVYNGNVGTHFNYYKRAKGKYILEDIPMKWVNTTPTEALVWTHMQCLMGDTSDGIKGIHRCGPAKAIKLLCPTLMPVIEQHKQVYKTKHGKAVASEKLWERIILANDVLSNLTTDRQALWNIVSQAYLTANMTEAEATLNMRLVSMHQLDKGGKLCLWTQPTE